MRFSLYLSYFIPLYKLQTMDMPDKTVRQRLTDFLLPRGKTSLGTWVPAN